MSEKTSVKSDPRFGCLSVVRSSYNALRRLQLMPGPKRKSVCWSAASPPSATCTEDDSPVCHVGPPPNKLCTQYFDVEEQVMSAWDSEGMDLIFGQLAVARSRLPDKDAFCETALSPAWSGLLESLTEACGRYQNRIRAAEQMLGPSSNGTYHGSMRVETLLADLARYLDNNKPQDYEDALSKHVQAQRQLNRGRSLGDLSIKPMQTPGSPSIETQSWQERSDLVSTLQNRLPKAVYEYTCAEPQYTV